MLTTDINPAIRPDLYSHHHHSQTTHLLDKTVRKDVSIKKVFFLLLSYSILSYKKVSIVMRLLLQCISNGISNFPFKISFLFVDSPLNPFLFLLLSPNHSSFCCCSMYSTNILSGYHETIYFEEKKNLQNI